jgi:hypothetical protein
VTERNVNVFTGLVVLAVVALLLIVGGLIPLLRGKPVPPKTFIAYLDESGGIREGDAVRISGRRAGYVSNVTMMQHEGSIKARVEFVIQAGDGSPWLNELRDTGIPHDSSIRVRQARMLGRPRLEITIGQDTTQTIADGGEWNDARGAGGDDEFTGWQQDIDRARDQIARIVAVLDDRELFENLNSMLKNASAALRDVEATLARNTGFGTQLWDTLDSATRAMDEVTADLRQRREGEQPDSSLTSATEGLIEFERQLAELDGHVADIEREIARIEEQTDGAVDSFDSDELSKLGLELRRQAARLRSSMFTSVSDPKRFGDMPGWRQTRPFYHGGEPHTGTSIDDTPPPAPGERTGVPRGK